MTFKPGGARKRQRSAPVPMCRREGWERRLADFVVSAQRRVFQWGEFDCCSMPCEAALEIGGVDPWSHFRGRYKSDRGAAAIILRAGGFVKLIEKIMSDVSAPEVAVSFARRGDILLVTDTEIVEPGFDAMLAVCLGHDMGFVTRDRGFCLLPVTRAARAWGVG